MRATTDLSVIPAGLNIARASMAVVGVLILALLTGCVTESTNRRIESNPSRALEDHVSLGLSYISQGNRDSARHHLLKAMEIDKRSPSAHNGMALLYQLEKENELAEEHFTKALSLDRNYTRARNNYGVFLYQQGRLEEALAQFEQAARDTSYDLRPQVFVSLGVIASRLGRDEQAVAAWERAIALNPKLPSPYLELAEYYLKAGDYVRAKRMLNSYDQRARPSAKSLWLAVRVEHVFDNRDARDSKGLALEKLFPYSQENLEYQEWLKNERNL